MSALIAPRRLVNVLVWMIVGGLVTTLSAQEIITLDSVPNRREAIAADEPLADKFSAKQAAIYLDRAALTWQKEKNCATCHTNMPYLFARPALAAVQQDSGEVREFFEQYRTVRWKKRGPTQKQGFWPIVVGAGLTFNDLQTTGKLSPVTRDVLDLLWTVQREDGGWRWPHCDYAPMEIDDHYGVTLAALTVGIAPDGYAQTPAAKAGLEKLRTYLKNNPPKSLHHRAMIAWCSLRLGGIASDEDRARTVNELLSIQRGDGGWSTAGFLTDWEGLQRDDGQPLDTETSDAYATGLVIVISRELGIPADDARLQKGIGWLLSNQRKSGKWFTRSPVKDAGNLISNTGTAIAVLALQSCGELPGWPLATADREPTRKLVDTLKAHVTKLAVDIGERNLVQYDKLNESADWIEDKFKEFGYAVSRQTYSVADRDCHNIVAEKTGETLPDEIVIVGAHYDSVMGSPGANDNGSGTASMLVLAEMLKDTAHDRTIRFVAFTNEEPPYFQRAGKMGSWVYAKQCRQNQDDIVGVLSLETMGYFSNEENSQKYPPPLDRMYPSTGNFIGMVSNLKSRPLLEKCVKTFKQGSDVPCQSASLPESMPGVGWSDHWSFWQEDYAGVMVTDTAPFRYPHYHLPSDTVDKIDFATLAQVVAGLKVVVTELAGQRTRASPIPGSRAGKP